MKTYRILLGSMMLATFVSLSAQERQVPFFPDQGVMTIDRKYAEKMSFFTEYDDFVEAQLFRLPDGKFALEIFVEEGDALVKERMVMTEKEKVDYLNGMLRRYAEEQGEVISEPGAVSGERKEKGELAQGEVAQGEAAGDDSGLLNVDLLNQKGRSPMLVMNTLAGLGFYGYALPITFQVEDDKAFVGLYMLAAGASFYIPYRITDRKNVSLAQASLNFYGISRGGMHGAFLGELLADNPDWNDYFTEDYTGQYPNSAYDQAERDYDRARDQYSSTLFGMGIVSSIAGGIAGFKLAERWEYDGGSTSVLQMWGDFGTGAGLLLADVFDFYDRRELDAVFATAMGMSAVGMTGGKLFFGDTRNYTLGDAIVYRSTIALTAMPLITIVDYFQPDESTAYSVAGLAGIAAGGYLGWRATLNKDFDTGDGVYVALGELAGGLLGLGMGYLVSADMESQLLFTTATLGAVAGYGLMFSKLAPKSLKVADRRGMPPELNTPGLNGTLDGFGLLPREKRSPDITFRLNPAGVMMNMVDVNVSPAMSGVYSAASLSVRF